VSQRVATGSRPLANGIGGVSTRRVDELAQAKGLNGICKSTVSTLCKE
jgi:transposase-like protein